MRTKTKVEKGLIKVTKERVLKELGISSVGYNVKGNGVIVFTFDDFKYSTDLEMYKLYPLVITDRMVNTYKAQQGGM